MKRFFIIVLAAMSLSVSANAQTDSTYTFGNDYVAYRGYLLKDADAASFIILGHGYAKDSHHVWLNGKRLDYVDASTFKIDSVPSSTRIMTDTLSTKKAKADKPTILDRILGTDEVESEYTVSGDVVSYEGRPVKHADARTFQYVGGDYAADEHHAFYKGRILGDAWGRGLFKYKGNGYATDGVHWYSNGRLVDRD